MITARNVVIVSIALAVFSLAWGVVSLWRPPDSGGTAGDTFGTRAHGQKALFEIMQELDVPAERMLFPSPEKLPPHSTFVLWRPHQNLVQIEPIYLQSLAAWVRSGGRIVVAPDRTDESPLARAMAQVHSKDAPRSVLEELGLPNVTVETIALPVAAPGGGAPAAPVPLKRRRTLVEDLETSRQLLAGTHKTVPIGTVAVTSTGTLDQWQPSIAKLEIQELQLGVIDPGETPRTGSIEMQDADGKTRVLAAAFPVGQGEVVVVGSYEIAENRTIAKQDNSVLMARLLAGGSGPVVFDEFYHGLTVRGNPLWLFSRPGYFATTVCLLAALGLWIWRDASFLGPPLVDTTRPRRSIGEYVEAMARFFLRGRGSRPFLLRQVRDGSLVALRRELGLAPGRERVDELTAVLSRREPDRARRLEAAVTAIDRQLSSPQRPRADEVLRLIQGISNCL